MTETKVYSNKDIIKAGKILSKMKDYSTEEIDFAFSALSYWRYSHNTALLKAYNFVGESSKEIDKYSIVAKRLKRKESIIYKLVRFKGMSLRSMNDIAGCRVIISDLKKARRLLRGLKKDEHFQREIGYKINDYIEKPQEDGYRGVHIISKFENDEGKLLNVEIQIRTLLQHYWATSVEIIDILTGQNLKQKKGERKWSHFFQLVSDQFSNMDDIQSFVQLEEVEQKKRYSEFLANLSPPYIEKNWDGLVRIRQLSRDLDVSRRLRAFAASVKVIEEHLKSDERTGYVLVELDVKKNILKTRTFLESESRAAEAKLTEIERREFSRKDFICALVSTNSISGLKEAFPNYFADSTNFITFLKLIEEAAMFVKPNRFVKFMSWLKLP
ncbi:RelA/SpoT domain-containing protein [Reinekea blandensis]|nr:RelA/SpoT domain-containing protein [Reinekea blandensis]